MIDKPNAASTPNTVFRPTGRKAIGDRDGSIQSPIKCSENRDITKSYEKKPSRSSDEYSQSDDEYSFPESGSDNENVSNNSRINSAFCNCLSPIWLLIIGVSFVSVYCLSFGHNDKNTLEKVSLEFPKQVEDFWQTIHVSIKEINRYNHPQSLVFLYKENSYLIINKLMSEVSKYATCELTSCEETAVKLRPSDFKTIDILEDYGVLIEKYRDALQRSGVMIVSNLEQIPGKAAQAFHSFCDEENPVVRKALFLFTMKVDELPKSKSLMGYVDNHLNVLWNNIRKDNLQPLITRMTNNVLPVLN